MNEVHSTRVADLSNSDQLQYSIHLPSPYVSLHLGQLLPSWSVSASSMLLILQRSPCTLFERILPTEIAKNRLRNQFLQIGLHIASQLSDRGYVTEVFDPKTGLPVLSTAGSLQLDDVAIARTMLGYATLNHGNCSILLHPTWGSAVYPATLISSAPCYVLADVVRLMKNEE